MNLGTVSNSESRTIEINRTGRYRLVENIM